MLLKEIIENYLSGSLGNYVDFACGTGRIISAVEQYATNSIGVDVSETMINEARRKCKRTEFFVQDVTKQPLTLPTIDVATAFRFFGNAQQELRKSVLQFLHSTLRTGGHLILNNHRNPHSVQNRLFSLTGGQHEMDLTYGKLRKLLEEQGFQIAMTFGIGGWILRHSFARREIFESAMSETFEKVSRILIPPSLCPDMIVIAKKL